MTRVAEPDSEFPMRDTTSHPLAYVPSDKTSVSRSPEHADRKKGGSPT
ncbi:hypothetical protein P3W85_44150 [Cupriavidus basilensis]|uniref:Uncharacterized protein n=1 Tax=Cupriavidus basilensis TaxID=68895 RepID=A0ABT6B4S3_9BURK|nr:hypothetical protein [Cupriavidus basilensis]MDF3839880.1 hypothetical protein [Cupriavidus basilensis]